jgi:hypothetical protein
MYENILQQIRWLTGQLPVLSDKFKKYLDLSG